MSTEINIQDLTPIIPNDERLRVFNSIQDKTFVGIDFGTSTTVVSIAKISQGETPIQVGTIDLNQKLVNGLIHTSYKIPSVIAWYNNGILVGEGAAQIKHKLKFGKNLWHSFKMELGEDVGCKYPNSELHKDHERYVILNPTDASTIFFSYLKAQIQRYITTNNLPQQVEYAVSVPASFEANQRKDLIKSLESNGFNISKQALIDEPNAAFLSYVARTHNGGNFHVPFDYENHVLVFDFGAGTCDISVLELGRDNNGVYSKNVAISKFTELGGNDFDKLIALDILIPQLLDGSGFSLSDFRTSEVKKGILPQLLPIAEKLKIQASESIALGFADANLGEIESSDDYVSLGTSTIFATSKGEFSLQQPTLSLKQFVGVSKVFTDAPSNLPVKRMLRFENIFTPIKSALKKARLSHSEIDYVLFIGGSAKNTLIQKAVSEYFEDAESLIPSDLQAHVSAGAAVHSLIFNGFSKNIIQPITSEPIILITTINGVETEKVIVKAGTEIPSDKIHIDSLFPNKDGQNTIELPICVSNTNKMLFNFKIPSPSKTGFSINDEVKLYLEINADKGLIINARVGDKSIITEPLNPYTNSELTSEERIIKKAERDFNLAVEKNGGEPSYQILYALYSVYKNLEQEFKAAELLEEISERFPNNANYNNVGLHYSNSGDNTKAIKFYEKANSNKPSEVTLFNIAHLHYDKNKELYKVNLEKSLAINPNYNHALYSLGQLYKNEGEIAKGEEYMRKAYDSWAEKFENNELGNSDYNWFAACAKQLGYDDLAEKVLKAAKKKDITLNYNVDNLSQVKQRGQLN